MADLRKLGEDTLGSRHLTALGCDAAYWRGSWYLLRPTSLEALGRLVQEVADAKAFDPFAPPRDALREWVGTDPFGLVVPDWMVTQDETICALLRVAPQFASHRPGWLPTDDDQPAP